MTVAVTLTLAVALVALVVVVIAQADRFADALDRRDRAFLAVNDQIAAILADDRAERRTLLHLLTSRTMQEYASVERQTAQAVVRADVRRPKAPDDFVEHMERLMDAAENGTPDPAILSDI